MVNYPSGDLPKDVVGVVASYFAGGSGPSHSNLGSAFDAAGIDEPEGDANKEARVQRAFATAGSAEQRYLLLDEMLELLRNAGAFSRKTMDDIRWAKRVIAAVEHAGGWLDENGYLTWPDDLDQIIGRRPSVTAQVSARLAERAAAAQSRAANRPEGVIARSETPPRTQPDRRVESAQEKETKIFLVHGHDELARNVVESFVTRATGIVPTVLMLEANSGRTVIEKFELHADTSSFAIVLMTADDLGQSRVEAEKGSPPNVRARQNVVFEFGYFVGYLRRSRVAALVAPEVERPSDIAGVVYLPFVVGDAQWKEDLRRELRAAGIPITG